MDIGVSVRGASDSAWRNPCPDDKVKVGLVNNITKLSKVEVGNMTILKKLAKLELGI